MVRLRGITIRSQNTFSPKRSGSSSVALKEVCIHGQDAYHYMELMEVTSLRLTKLPVYIDMNILNKRTSSHVQFIDNLDPYMWP